MVLVGLPGSGKSTIGRLLAQRLNYHYLDTDDWVESFAGKSIVAIFENDGEAEFRLLEERALTEALQCQRCVVATGGGVVLRDKNRAILVNSGWPVIYLKADIYSIAKRLRNDTRRPLMRNQDPLVRLKDLEGIRHPLYEMVCTQSVECSKKSTSVIVNTILGNLERSPR